MKQTLARAAKRGFSTAGLQVSRATPSTESRRMALIREHGIGTVIDVGANQGQYGTELRESGFEGDIISFEPIAVVFEALNHMSAADSRWTALRLGLADSPGTATINVGGDSAISSLFEMSERLGSALPTSSVVATETIEIDRLDAVPQVRDARGPFMLKVDVQGAELLVLRGAEGMLHRVELLELELTMRELYRDQPLFTDVVEDLARAGFALVALEPGFRDLVTGEYLQFDGFFTRASSR